MDPPSEHQLGGKGRVATLGMFIIDQFQTTGPDGQTHISSEVMIGGGGIYAMVCARMFLPARHCGMIIDTGLDFPTCFRSELEQFGNEMTWFRPRDGLTTRALNMYSGVTVGEGHQSFRYLAPQLRLHLSDLLLPPSPMVDPSPEWVHIVCVTDRAKAMVQEAKTLQVGTPSVSWRGKLVWEPLPPCCIPSELPAFVEIAPHLAVISPNLLELQALLDIPPSSDPTNADVEMAARSLRTAIQTQTPAIIVRAGRLGSYTLHHTWSGWVRPFFTSEQQDRVVDPTGGGNGFLGGLCAGLLLSDGDFRIASLYAAAAASFAIEQKGLPRLVSADSGKEIWNGTSPWTRLHELGKRHTNGPSAERSADGSSASHGQRH